MNLPNRLTVARFFLTVLFVLALSVSGSWRYAYVTGLLLFVLASATDYADGAIARRYQLETNFGRLMDPLADKILLAAAFICLVADHAMPAWAATVIISREFLITGLRLLAASQGIVLSADNAGKHKTVWQIVTVLYFLGLGAWRELFVARAQGAVWHLGGLVLIGLALTLTLYSGCGYLWKNRQLVRGI